MESEERLRDQYRGRIDWGSGVGLCEPYDYWTDQIMGIRQNRRPGNGRYLWALGVGMSQARPHPK